MARNKVCALLWPLWFALFASTAHAEVLDILSAHEILVPYQNGQCQKGSILAIFSQDGEKDPLGFAEIQEEKTNACVATVNSHTRAGIIRKGDRAVLLDLTRRNTNLPGRYDLVREGERKNSSRYKPVVYIGYNYGQSAATLDKGEFLLGIGPLAYGITNQLQIDTAPLLFAANIGSLGVKYKFFQNEDMRLSVYGQGAKFFNSSHGAWSTELNLDSISNGSSMTHTKVRFASRLPDSVPLTDKDKEKKYSTELSSVYEWILPSWHRLFLGPKFTAGEENSLGCVFMLLLVYDTFHFNANLTVNSFDKLDFKNNKQTIGFDLYWRW